MTFILGNRKAVALTCVGFVALGFSCFANAANSDDAEAVAAIENVKSALKTNDYASMWQEMDKLTTWLEANAPRDGLRWTEAEQMIKTWIKKNWREDVIKIKALTKGGMEETTERHQASFHGWTWDTGEKTVTTDFVFEAKVKAVNAKGKILNHSIRFHFDKGRSGWVIKRAGVM
jgi:hypothetical protein